MASTNPAQMTRDELLTAIRATTRLSDLMALQDAFIARYGLTALQRALDPRPAVAVRTVYGYHARRNSRGAR